MDNQVPSIKQLQGRAVEWQISQEEDSLMSEKNNLIKYTSEYLLGNKQENTSEVKTSSVNCEIKAIGIHRGI